MAVIRGASSGIGMAFARKLAAHHDLVLIAGRKDRLEVLAARLVSEFGTSVTVHPADLTRGKDLEIVARGIAAEDDLALLVNNAGFGTNALFWNAEMEGREQMHRLHVMATVRLIHIALKKMVQRNAGGIINVASVSAFVRTAENTSYSATKSWITSFTEGLCLELNSVQSAVKVQALCPGFTHSDFTTICTLIEGDSRDLHSG
jgi:short-subunit dehydrogenase